MVATSIEAKYKDLQSGLSDTESDQPMLGRAFLEKIIQIPFAIPRVDSNAFTAFINRKFDLTGQQERSIAKEEEVSKAKRLIEEQQKHGKSLYEAFESVLARSDISEEAVAIAEVEMRARSFGDSTQVLQAVSYASPYLGFNPRKAKRFINSFKLQALIANRRGLLNDGTIQLDVLAGWLLISMNWPVVREAVTANREVLSRLLQAYDLQKDLLKIENETDRAEIVKKLEPLLADPRIRQLHKSEELNQVLKDISGSEDEASPYLHLTEVTASQVVTEGARRVEEGIESTGVEEKIEMAIERAIERERAPERPVSGSTRTKFINHPPLTAPSYFQDREVETKLIGDFLKNDALRLMTVVGRGGTGKTVMVCRLLKSLEGGRLPDEGGELSVDGIVYLSERGSRGVSVPYIFADLCQLLPNEVVEDLDKLYKNPQASIEAKIYALLEAFPTGRYVLLLDNFEEVIDPETREIKDTEARNKGY